MRFLETCCSTILEISFKNGTSFCLRFDCKKTKNTVKRKYDQRASARRPGILLLRKPTRKDPGDAALRAGEARPEQGGHRRHARHRLQGEPSGMAI